jgi:hypothetical protein
VASSKKAAAKAIDLGKESLEKGKEQIQKSQSESNTNSE